MGSSRDEQTLREIYKLKVKIRNLQKEVAIRDDKLRRSDRALDALGRVWCNGGCAGGVLRFQEEIITREEVLTAANNTKRLLIWWNNYAAKHGLERIKWDDIPSYAITPP